MRGTLERALAIPALVCVCTALVCDNALVCVHCTCVCALLCVCALHFCAYTALLCGTLLVCVTLHLCVRDTALCWYLVQGPGVGPVQGHWGRHVHTEGHVGAAAARGQGRSDVRNEQATTKVGTATKKGDTRGGGWGGGRSRRVRQVTGYRTSTPCMVT